jgi:stage II sporulation protein M
MLEFLINPKRAEKHPAQMFFIGLIYASLAIFASYLVSGENSVLSKYSGMFVIIFTVAFTLPFMYYTLKLEERKDKEYDEETTLLKEHSKAIFSFLWLFVGFVVAFSFWYIALDNGEEFFRAQIETFCQINRPDNFNDCVTQYGLKTSSTLTGAAASSGRLISIFVNNVYVLMFTLLFSLLFGAGAIFILAWNASVIAAAIGIFTKSDLSQLPGGLLRYLIHGIPEIAAYFVAALAGGILSIAIIRRDFRSERFWAILEDVLYLIVLAIVILIIAAIIEVFITPKLF